MRTRLSASLKKVKPTPNCEQIRQKGVESEFVPCSCLKFRTLRNVIMQQRKILGKSVSSGRPVQLDAAAITAIL